jgi:ligand-binding SRPBCC domain-containing protein
MASFERSFVVQVPIDIVWDFHCNPIGLTKITHCISAVSDGTLIADIVQYEMPFGILGRIADRVAGRLLIGALFAARVQVTRATFEDNTQPDAGVSLA